ncbi:hypothetical protein CYLTODRAFT_415468 [Cylindrobasidium torrendii FP15055 ss-10]|uniref:Uncharacterized protein n=1 Tax=Cylindrobasidium torrendii FP15055 ss-10 TaxID=1314674 RepID=A0A0D7AU57_9AGAR|nr:hypothetical protein CYLTODRAFT_415468 [Cylindrobasidium torrendii FP15055 ss-10]
MRLPFCILIAWVAVLTAIGYLQTTPIIRLGLTFAAYFREGWTAASPLVAIWISFACCAVPEGLVPWKLCPQHHSNAIESMLKKHTGSDVQDGGSIHVRHLGTAVLAEFTATGQQILKTIILNPTVSDTMSPEWMQFALEAEEFTWSATLFSNNFMKTLRSELKSDAIYFAELGRSCVGRRCGGLEFAVNHLDVSITRISGAARDAVNHIDVLRSRLDPLLRLLDDMIISREEHYRSLSRWWKLRHAAQAQVHYDTIAHLQASRAELRTAIDQADRAKHAAQSIWLDLKVMGVTLSRKDSVHISQHRVTELRQAVMSLISHALAQEDLTGTSISVPRLDL